MNANEKQALRQGIEAYRAGRYTAAISYSCLLPGKAAARLADMATAQLVEQAQAAFAAR